MTATFQIHASELNPALLEKLRSVFSGDEMRVIVTDVADDADYPYNNPVQVQHLLGIIDDINQKKNLVPFDRSAFE